MKDITPRHELGSYRIKENERGFCIEQYRECPEIEEKRYFLFKTRKIVEYYDWRPLTTHLVDQYRSGQVVKKTLQEAKDFIDTRINLEYKMHNPTYTYHPPESNIRGRGPVSPSPPEKNPNT